MSSAGTTRGGGALGGLLATAGGLLLAGATVAAWVTRTMTRELVGVEVSDIATTSGVQFAPAAVPLGVAAALGGLLLLALPAGLRAIRRVLGLVILLAGVAGIAVLALGLAGASTAGGALRATPGLAVLGALAVTVGGGAAVRRPSRRPLLDARYDIDVDADVAEDTDEWQLASAEEEEPR